MPAASSHSKGLTVVAIVKLLEAVALVLLAAGAFHMLHRDIEQTLTHWVRAVRIDPENRFLAGLLAKAGLVDDRKLKQLGGLTLVYAALFVVEGTGLLMRKRWAEYLTVIATASLIPIEGYEIWKHVTAIKILVLLANVAIVIYLIVVLRQNGAAAKRQG